MERPLVLSSEFDVPQASPENGIHGYCLNRFGAYYMVVPGKSLGRVYLGYTPAQVHKTLGKPDKTLRLKNGLLDDIYRAKKTRTRDGQSVRDKVEILYRKGRVVQIEATSPAFETANGLSTSSTVSRLTTRGLNWRVLVYGYDHPESGWSNYYLVDQKKGLTFEFEGCQDYLYDFAMPTTIIHHRAPRRVAAYPRCEWQARHRLARSLGRHRQLSAALRMAGEQSAEPFSSQLQPGITKKFTLVFDAPDDAKGLKLHIPAGGFGFGKSADIQVPGAGE